MAGSDFRDRSVIGKWQLVALLDLASIASLDEAEARTLLGKFLTISETGVQVDQEVCPQPEFWAERITPESHIQEKLHASAERMRLPTPAVMVELGCTDVYVRNPGQLVLLWGGAMFDAVRIDRGRQAKQMRLPVAKRLAGKAESGRVRGIGKALPKKSGIKKSAYPERRKAATAGNPDRRKKPVNRWSK